MKVATLPRAACLLLSALGVPPLESAVIEPPAQDAAIVHALNRLGYGPRPGDVARVRDVGLDKWVDSQLHPDRLSDKDVEARIATLRTAGLSSADLIKHYQLPPAARKEFAERKAAIGEGATEEAVRQIRRDVAQKYGGDMEGGARQVVDELQQAKVVRAIYSERQLGEVMVDFWMNHFNVYADKGQDKFLLGEFERRTIRPHAWGKFEDLLRATAESPAMLFYLDNWLSSDPNAPAPGSRLERSRRFGQAAHGAAGPPTSMTKPGQDKRRGLNENYAREIMELHTLGVDGGYTQTDVTEIARCFTGWTINGLGRGAQGRRDDPDPEFAFVARLHDKRDKTVLGQRIRGGGKEEGDEVIHILATQPATARLISLKLARRFVSDAPPATLVDRAAETFRRTDGDIRAVLTTIVTSPEFQAPEARSAKVKTPLEFVVSSVRAVGADVSSASDLARRIASMGMPLYRQQPPTGYKDTAEAWISTGSLLARLNFALDLSAGKVSGAAVPAQGVAAAARDSRALADALALRLVPSGLSQQTRQTIDAEAATGLNPARIAGLILGSPEFQRK
jgi:uncharacterized protein (DUF1800 family)